MSQNDFLIGLLIGLFGGLIAFLFRESISRKKIFGMLLFYYIYIKMKQQKFYSKNKVLFQKINYNFK